MDLVCSFRGDIPKCNIAVVASVTDKIQSLTACTQYPRYDEKVLYFACDVANNLNKRQSHYNSKKIKVLACPFCGTSSHGEIIHIENHTYKIDIYFWCKTCNAKGFAWNMHDANRNEVESKYPYHPALEEKGIVFCKTELEYIHNISISDLRGYRVKRSVDAVDVLQLIDDLSSNNYDYDSDIECKNTEIFEKYEITTDWFNKDVPFPCINVGSYNLEKPNIPYPANMNFHQCGDMTVIVLFTVGRLYYNCRDMPWFSKC